MLTPTRLLSPLPRVWVRAQKLGRSATRRVCHRLDDSFPDRRWAYIESEEEVASRQGGAQSDVQLYSSGSRSELTQTELACADNRHALTNDVIEEGVVRASRLP